ncbi:MAG: DNA-processing protein DprA [Alphaproteobacteria bacterium]|nr:DNA-processing protein DprA [Alphaproteobacteria bacterium]MBU1560836.1 DNA-processing protein DprA [Alphaproteobacteria bacterium]MBU2304810.1 DNA-processing protein DprA [Alphaproteobacteria bacterium]MBU2370106.1 DNA-processing protein DprA [Alphaproteobacteria bacterium]
MLTDAQRIAWLRLVRSDNVGPATFRQLLNRFPSAEAALEALPGLLKRTGKPLRITSQAAAEDEIAGLSRYGARLVASGEPDYPYLLKFIPAAPPLVTMAGGANLDWQRTVGIVGARNASAAGIKMTRMLAGDLGERGYTVVSGLARGIDTAAHKATLNTGTIAVLAGGFDKIYPDENIPLAHDILDNGGALLTEMPLGWEPRARDFPRRNRLVSGLSLGIVVVEAAKRSGSLITARLALEQNRDVFAVPGSPLDPRAEGGNALIQQGARLVTCAEDIIETLGSADPARNALFDRDWEPDLIPEAHPPSDDDRSRLLAALGPTPVEVDELVRQSGLSASAMQMLLLELDLAGQIEWSSGQLVALKY